MLGDNEIIVSAYAVKYRSIEYYENYVVITQNRIRRRVYKGFFFVDTGIYIYVSGYFAGLFQHKSKPKMFVVNKETKEWRVYDTILVEKHKPEKIEPKESNEISSLKSE